MINQTSIRSYNELSFADGMRQIDKIRQVLMVREGATDAELSHLTGIPRHLVPARRNELVELGAVVQRGTTIDPQTHKTVSVWELSTTREKRESEASKKAVKNVIKRYEESIANQKTILDSIEQLPFI